MVHRAADPAQARQDPLVLEPAAVCGVVQQDGLARGGPDRTGTGDGVPHEAVDQGRLPGAGGSAHDGEERRVQAPVAGQDVVLQLGQGVADVQPRLVRAGQGQRQHGRREGRDGDELPAGQRPGRGFPRSSPLHHAISRWRHSPGTKDPACWAAGSFCSRGEACLAASGCVVAVS